MREKGRREKMKGGGVGEEEEEEKEERRSFHVITSNRNMNLEASGNHCLPVL